VRHEQGATRAAEGYARSTGKCGVCLVTSGPGATNAITGIVDALMDSIPMVVITGQVATHLIGSDAFQEADTVGITRSCTKHNYLVKSFHDLPRIMAEAFYIARTGRPGPVLVDIPKDIQQQRGPYAFPDRVNLRGYKPHLAGHVPAVRKAVDLILGSQRVILYTGGGVIHSMAHEELRRLVELLDAPCTNTLMGLGGLPGEHPNFVGMLGMHGSYAANMAMDQADLIVAIGARFDDRVTGRLDKFSLGSRKIHIDVDPTSISKNVRVDVPIVGDVRNVLRKLCAELAERTKELAVFHDHMRAWREQVAGWAREHPFSFSQDSTQELKAQFVIARLYEHTKARDCFVTTEVGQHQMWTAQFYKFARPRQWLTSGGLGTMGYGFPAAVGAQVAHPQATVLCVAGDGSFLMNVQELATCVQYRIPVKIAIINNGFLGMVRQWQQLFHGSRYSETEQVQPDFAKLAEAFGAVGLRATRVEEVDSVIERMLAMGGPVVADFVVAKEDNVYPMVPAGAALSEMILEKK